MILVSFFFQLGQIVDFTVVLACLWFDCFDEDILITTANYLADNIDF